MLDRRTGVILLCVDSNNHTYSRYAGVAGNRAKLLERYHSDFHLTQDQAELLRSEPERVVPITVPPMAA
jgi:hypothetical protein